MKPSFIDEQEALAEYFEAIAAAERAIAQAFARRAELVEAGRRFGQARANAAARLPGCGTKRVGSRAATGRRRTVISTIHWTGNSTG
ncbi:hypothetical protein E3T23_03205 [Cryobacterium cheniae]|uniref:DUF222 domain-containing protein n=1 Tax=Cryobacterium cheniae TaxID=1259262 RepID=A0A4R8XVY2_9MICO|nr:hypothetical protein [Cryobacterium cheniae]TFC83093.1 hypothetical protein E3T23_03205 [Cryobacterium cheniae]